MLNNLGIGFRLALSFGIIVALLIGATSFGLVQMDAIDGSTTRIVHERWPETVAANKVIDTANMILDCWMDYYPELVKQ